MQRIVQEDGTGCGLACVAMIAEVPYQDVREFAVDWLEFDEKGPFYTCISDLRYMLSEYGYALSRKTPFKSYETLSPLSILEIERPGEYNHWVLMVKCGLDSYILDPSAHIRTERRQDWWRIHALSYTNVTRLSG